MNTALLMQFGVPALIGVVSAVAGHWFGKKSASSQAVVQVPAKLPPVFDHLNDPVVQLVLGKLVKAAHDSGHAALDATITKLMPGLAPVLPAINQVVDAVEAKVVK
jgi:hypothetical protein